MDALEQFSPITRDWFNHAFAAPTPCQTAGWAAIARGEHTLILAPTGSGKTLAAFLWCLDQLARQPSPPERQRCRVLYVSPLKALTYDVERNLRAPLAGLRLAAQRLDLPMPPLDVAVRTGDTSQAERRDLVRHPPDILITTPESLYLLLTARSREILRSIRWVIVDEIHALAGSKRGVHLALSLERLEELAEGPIQRIGLSATQRPLDEIGRFLGGAERPVTLVDARQPKPLRLEVIVPIEDMARPDQATPAAEPPSGSILVPTDERQSIWPSIYPRLLELIRQHRSTLIFVNSRRLAERLAQRLNELDAASAVEPDAETSRHGDEASEQWGNRTIGQVDDSRLPDASPLRPISPSPHPSFPASPRPIVSASPRPAAPASQAYSLVRAHHGSLAAEHRRQVEEALKMGLLRGLVATSSLELGIDMGAIDLVVMVESPPSVASGLQRVGRAGHAVDAVSNGLIFPKYRGDLLEATVVADGMRRGEIESTRVPRNCLDVLAQQLVAMCALEPWPVDRLYQVVRRAYPYAELPRAQFDGVLEMLAGRYPSDEFAELKPRLVWDRAADTVVARHDARVIAITSGGTIPDRGLYGVHLGHGGPRLGELDEEMVYESRLGEVFLLGASAWRIEQITPNQVIVSPAPGQPGKMPFWKGDAVGRPIELGRALGAFVRRVGSLEAERAEALLRDEYGLDELAARNLVAYLAEQREVTGALPSDRTIVVERFRDELGDWRLCLLTPFGGRVHAPWALAIEARLRERGLAEVQTLWSDDGIIIRLPEALDEPLDELLFPDADAIEDLVVSQLGGSALFATRFRENAARALLLPRRRGRLRTPLWQQRQRAADLLKVASRYGSFPILLETYRECLQDVFDLPALAEVLRAIEQREIRVVSVETPAASPFASSLLFEYIAEYLYEGDLPLAERRAQALALDRERLRELLGQEELRELLDPAALAEVELELQGLGERRVRSVDGLHDLLRRLGELSVIEVAARLDDQAAPLDGPAEAPDPEARRLALAERWLAELAETWRAVPIRLAGQERWIAAEDIARYRDALGVAPPRGAPEALLEETADPLGGLLARWARTHGPFTARQPAERWGLPPGLIETELHRLAERGVLLQGGFRPGGSEREWCDPDVLRRLRRRSLARLRREIEPVPREALGRFLPAWQGVDADYGGYDRLLEVVAQLEGTFLPWSILERDVLPRRVRGYQPRMLDDLCAAGEVVWVGRGALGANDGRVALYRRERVTLLAPRLPESPPGGPLHQRIREHLAARGASFFRDLWAAVGTPPDAELLEALWDLVWAGEVTNDTLTPLRLRLARRKMASHRPPRLTRAGPPEAAGRWSLVASLGAAELSETDRLHAAALSLLVRHGLVTRETVVAEGLPGGFAALYPVLRAMEEAGQARRGYFIEGLGGAQFALPGAVDRLRAERHPPEQTRCLILAAADPANPYGAALPWPPRRDGARPSPQRTAGAYVVLVDGQALLYLERSGRGLITLAPFAEDERGYLALAALRRLAEASPRRQLTLERVDGQPVLESPLHAALLEVGFARDYLGLTLWADLPARRAPSPVYA